MTETDNLTSILLFKVLSNNVRLRLINSLVERERTVSELCRDTDEEQTRVSHELRCLVVCGLVNYRRDGRMIEYSLNKRTVLPILAAAEKLVEKFGERMEGCEMISEARRMKVSAIAV